LIQYRLRALLSLAVEVGDATSPYGYHNLDGGLGGYPLPGRRRLAQNGTVIHIVEQLFGHATYPKAITEKGIAGRIYHQPHDIGDQNGYRLNVQIDLGSGSDPLSCRGILMKNNTGRLATGDLFENASLAKLVLTQDHGRIIAMIADQIWYHHGYRLQYEGHPGLGSDPFVWAGVLPQNRMGRLGPGYLLIPSLHEQPGVRQRRLGRGSVEALQVWNQY
jgi:hypothetical protein